MPETKFTCPNPLCKKVYEHDELDVGVIVCPSCGTPLIAGKVVTKPPAPHRSRMALAGIGLGILSTAVMIPLGQWPFAFGFGVFAIACGMDALHLIQVHPDVLSGKRIARVAVILGSIAFVAGFAMTLWALAQTRENMEVASAISKTQGDKARIKVVFKAIEKYRNEHGGEYPDSLEAVRQTYRNIFPGWYLDLYEYNWNPGSIVLYTREADIFDRRCVTFTDGRVKYLPEKEFREELLKEKTGEGSKRVGS